MTVVSMEDEWEPTLPPAGVRGQCWNSLSHGAVTLARWTLIWDGKSHTSTHKERAFEGKSFLKGLTSTRLQMGHCDKQMEWAPSTTAFRGWLWRSWVSPYCGGGGCCTRSDWPPRAPHAWSIPAGVLHRSCFNSIITGKCSKGSIRHKVSSTR